MAVAVPLRNEVDHVRQMIDSVLNQTFPPERLQVVAIDGESEDGTREVLATYARDYSRFRVLTNPRRTTPAALNLGIAATACDVVVRVDGHCTIAPDYVQRCVDHLAASGAANVGGLMRPVGTSLVGRAIAMAMQSRFGIGNARFHYLRRQAYVDTVYLGAFRREVLDEVGGFDEALIRNQDDELNYRIRRAGYSILLSPDIVSTYTPRNSLQALCRQFFQYGQWKVKVIRKHPGSVQLRHLAPVSLVLLLGTSLAGAVLLRRRWTLAPVALYGLADVLAAAFSAPSDPTAAPLVVAAFPCLHVSYGLGFLAGLANLLSNASSSLVRRGRD